MSGTILLKKIIGRSVPPRPLEKVLAHSVLQHAYRDLFKAISFEKKEEFWPHVIGVIGDTKVMEYLEFGVFEGHSIEYFSNGFGHKESRFFGFDSFEGLPEDWHSRRRKGHFTTDGAMPRLGDERVEFVKGWFQDTVPTFFERWHHREDAEILVHFDADLYSSSLFLLTYLWNYLNEYYFIFDEFTGDETRALFNFQQAYGCDVTFLAYSATKYFPVRVFGKIKNRQGCMTVSNVLLQ